MKKVINFLLALICLSSFASCDDAYEVNYNAPVKISFDGVEDGIAVTAKGADNYTAKIRVQATNGISYFEIYNADIKTGAKGSLIEGTGKSFDSQTEYTEEFHMTGLTDNKCIRVSVTDTEGTVIERNLLVKITPSVLFSETVNIETADDYYGSYYATWLNGRVYLRSNGEQYVPEIDFSMGMIDGIPSLISPAQRSQYNLPTFDGLKDTKFELTTLTITEYNNISKVNAEPISTLTAPTLSNIGISANKVYLFKTADGKKGLIAITSMTKRTGTIETANGEWVKDTEYYRVVITTKVIA